MDQTIDGLWVMGPAVHCCEKPVTPSALGSIAMNALRGGRRGIPGVTDWKQLIAPFLKTCNERSWSAIQRTFKNVDIEQVSATVRVTPSRNGGTAGDDKGFHPLGEGATEFVLPLNPATFGTAILESFTRCY
jgi:hypothetical protein